MLLEGGREGRNRCNSLLGGAVRIDISYKIEFIDIEVLYFVLRNMYLCISLFKSQQVFVDPKLWALMSALSNADIVTSIRM